MELMDVLGRKLVVQKSLIGDELIQNGLLVGHATICHPAAMIRADKIKKIGGYRPDFYPVEDLDLWLRLGEVGCLANLDDLVLRYRMTPTSISGLAARDGRQRAMGKKCCEQAWARRGLNNLHYEASMPWRAGEDKKSIFQELLKFGWWAFSSAEYKTAASYGYQALKQNPFSRQALMLFVKSNINRIKFL